LEEKRSRKDYTDEVFWSKIRREDKEYGGENK